MEKVYFRGLFGVFLLTASLKLTLFHCYRSTDFEVHRNWLAITSSLPVSKWYYENSSEWTLDYPPFFAWFEYFLSFFAFYFDQEMLKISNLNYASLETVLFQKLSVICGDVLLLISIAMYLKHISCKETRKTQIATFLFFGMLLNAGLIIVDHIHFQYNGFLFALLIFSITSMLQDKYLQSAFWFTILLNFKHIFLYIAPVYFVYLLRSYCFKQQLNTKPSGFTRIIGVNLLTISPLNILKLGFIVVSIFSLSFGPFIYMGQISQLLSRLFPVKRGLSHAYWAANFWALYNSADKVATILGPKFGITILNENKASLTGGLVAQQNFSVLPNIPPFITAIITVLAMMPALLKLWYRPYNRALFLPCLTLCAYASFLFGYHVHEKAILMVIVPMTFLSITHTSYARVYVIVSIIGHFALFPLLYEQAETPLKIVIFTGFTLFSTTYLKIIHSSTCHSSCGIPFVSFYEAAYLYGIIPLYLYMTVGHSYVGLSEKLPFLPLMMMSLYCSVGIIWSWLFMYSKFLMNISEEPKKKTK